MNTLNESSRTDAWQRLRNLSLPQKRVLGGVAAALGEVTPLAPWMWRVLFCTLTLFWGVGLLAYLILFVSIPNADEPGS